MKLCILVPYYLPCCEVVSKVFCLHFKVGLQGRLTELEETNINLRADQLRQELACDSARSAKESAQRIIEEREHRIAELHEELAKKDQVIRDQEREIQQLIDTVTGRENTEVGITYDRSC